MQYAIMVLLFEIVPGAGIEPAQHCCHWCLRPARLPIPPSGQLNWTAKIEKNPLTTNSDSYRNAKFLRKARKELKSPILPLSPSTLQFQNYLPDCQFYSLLIKPALTV